MEKHGVIHQTFRTVDTQTGGDPTRILIDGLPFVSGDTMLEKKETLIKHFDYIRSSLILEPRGHRDMFGAVILPPTLPQADIGVVFMDTIGYLNMCGHGTIGVVTALLETGILSKRGRNVQVILETPAGLVEANAIMNGEKVERVSFKNVPAFWVQKETVELPELGNVGVDVAFGGSFFGLVNKNDIGIDLLPSNAYKLAEIGMTIKEQLNNQLHVEHPQKKEINTIDLILILGESASPSVNSQNVAIFGNGQVARSACGTGLCAQMATLYAKGMLPIGETYITESIINTSFQGKLLGDTKVGDYIGAVPEIMGSAHIIGKHEFVLDPKDSLKYGFLLK